MKIGFIGLGNMAEAMIGGMLKQKRVRPEDIAGSAKTEATLEKIKEKFHISTVKTNAEAVRDADILFLAVKPVFLEEVIAEVKEAVSERTIIVSIVAGKTLSYLEEAFGRKDLKLVRCMPNTPALVLEGCTGVCPGEKVTEAELVPVTELLECFGKAIRVPERLMDALGALSGSSPAFVSMFIEALADGGVMAGLPRKQAYELAARSVLGSARMLLETGMHPGELKDMVCSPGGTTIEGIRTLEEHGMRAAVMDAVASCVEKTKRL